MSLLTAGCCYIPGDMHELITVAAEQASIICSLECEWHAGFITCRPLHTADCSH